MLLWEPPDTHFYYDAQRTARKTGPGTWPKSLASVSNIAARPKVTDDTMAHLRKFIGKGADSGVS